MSAVRFSVVRKFLSKSRLSPKLKLRGVDNRLVEVDSFLPLDIEWDRRMVNLNEVAVVKSCPFALILGVDWIVKSKTNLIVRDDRIVLQGENCVIRKASLESPVNVKLRKPTLIKKVRFAGVEEYPPEPEIENDLPFVSDELIATIKTEMPQKRFCGVKSVKLVNAVDIPGDSLLFVKGKLRINFSGTGMLRLSKCANPGMEWVIPFLLKMKY